METVEIIFHNIQSHEHTEFCLKPGMNFILADDNNVGKSTIFKVLTRIAKAPNIASNKILPLIRNGCSEAYAAFKFNGETVIAYFTNYKGEAAKLFFEHHHPDGDITRTVFCPQSLLKALGILVGDNGEIINFNDANSVQLISEVSTEADNIITHVMLDANVEKIKENLYSLGKQINSDIKYYTTQIETTESILADLQYVHGVDDFKENLPALEAGCRICDYGLVNISDYDVKVPWNELQLMKRMTECLMEMENFCESTDKFPTIDLSECKAGMRILNILDVLDLETLAKPAVDVDGFERVRTAMRVSSKLRDAVLGAQALCDLEKKLIRTVLQKQEFAAELAQMAEVIECPMKGKVYYTDEKCLPYRN